MSLGRIARLVGIGLAATVAMTLLVVAVTGLLPSSSDTHDVMVDLKVVKGYPDYYWAAAYVAEPLADEGYRKAAKSIGDRELAGRYGQVMVFDDQWARDMVLPENQSIDLTHEEMARWGKHQVMTYVHNADGYWFDR